MMIGPTTHGVLYHYTSHDALYKIVEGKRLRASHAYFLNDSSEIKYAIDRFIQIVNEKAQSVTDQQDSAFLAQVPSWLANMKSNPHYIFSFSLSEDGNVLSQWRAYTPYGTGVSIGLNKADLERLATKKGLTNQGIN